MAVALSFFINEQDQGWQHEEDIRMTKVILQPTGEKPKGGEAPIKCGDWSLEIIY